jgi:hypothetical protein
MAKLVPVDTEGTAPHVADVQGWLDDDDGFFAVMDTLVDGAPDAYPAYAALVEPG